MRYQRTTKQATVAAIVSSATAADSLVDWLPAGPLVAVGCFCVAIAFLEAGCQ